MQISRMDLADKGSPEGIVMAMRREMISLIGQRDALGGQETCPNIAERLRENYRPVRKVLGKRA
jgi:hypothetical protein